MQELKERSFKDLFKFEMERDCSWLLKTTLVIIY